MKNNITKLYNVIFPIWVLWLFPMTWFVVLPANFIIDLTVTFLTLKFMKVSNAKMYAKAVICKVWLIGFLSDFIGTAVMFSTYLIDSKMSPEVNDWWYDNIVGPVSCAPLSNVYAFLWTTVCIFIAGISIYFLNYKIAFKKLDLARKQKKKLALSLAVFTAPYLFYIPTKWFY